MISTKVDLSLHAFAFCQYAAGKMSSENIS